MELKLTKPLCFFDLETTGLDIGTSKIIEISILKITVDGKQLTYTQLINPECPIPAETTLIHKISDEDVKDKPTFKEVSKEINSFIGNSDLGGYNILRFDLPLLAEEFLRADIVFEIENRSIVDVQNIFHKMEPRNLSAAFKFYCNKELVDAHTAEADNNATWDVFVAQIQKYSNNEESSKLGFPKEIDIDKLAKFSIQKKFVDLAGHIVLNDKNEPIFNFGKHKGKKVETIFTNEPQYFDWLQKSAFPEYTKKVFQKLYLKKFGNDSIKLS